MTTPVKEGQRTKDKIEGNGTKQKISVKKEE